MEELKGAFIASLTRPNSQIKKDRAIAIGEAAQVIYKRDIEDLEIKIKRLKREQENALDLSPDSAISLKLAASFDEKNFVANDQRLSLEIRNTQIELDLAKERYHYLFEGE